MAISPFSFKVIRKAVYSGSESLSFLFTACFVVCGVKLPFYDCINLHGIHPEIGEVGVHEIPVFVHQPSTENVSRC